MINVAVCDDCIEDLEMIGRLLEQYNAQRLGTTLNVSLFSSTQSLCDILERQGHFDLFFLDILTPELNGIELGRRIRAYDRDTCIVYLTASRDFALEAYSVSATQYLLKPLQEKVLFSTLDSILARIPAKSQGSTVIKTKEGVVTVPYQDIAYVECCGHVLHFYLTDHTVVKSLHTRTAFKVTTAPLIRDRRFLSPHKSYLVNMDQVQKMTLSAFLMRDNTVIPISRNRYVEIKNMYLSYLSHKFQIYE